MFREFIRWALGPVGRELLQFYSDYSIPINIIVLIYGAILFVPHYSLIATINRIERMILYLSASRGAALDDLDALYEELIEEWISKMEGKNLLLPTKNDFWFELHPASEITTLLQIDKDYIQMALHKLTGNPPLRSFEPVKFQVWQKYRRRLKKGLRGYTPTEIFEMRERAGV